MENKERKIYLMVLSIFFVFMVNAMIKSAKLEVQMGLMAKQVARALELSTSVLDSCSKERKKFEENKDKVDELKKRLKYAERKRRPTSTREYKFMLSRLMKARNKYIKSERKERPLVLSLNDENDGFQKSREGVR